MNCGTEKYIIITGGDLFNKGAQAMTYITVGEMTRRFPECTCVLLSNKDVKRPVSEKENYKFLIRQRPGRKDAIYLNLPFLQSHADKQVKALFQNAVCQIDISGYALGSNWGINKALSYIRSIRLAKSHNIPVFLMPQSFGPFDFNGVKGWICDKLIEHYLKYPQVIMAREEEGFNLLKNRYHLDNIIKASDIVLQNKKLDLSTVLYNYDYKTQNIMDNSVAIIPNSKNNKYGNETEILKVYIDIIDYMRNLGKNVYILYHSFEDRSMCANIYNSCKGKTHFIDEELSCVQFDKIVNGFDFVVASRFHSIVYAYKNCVPAIILGWATKYNELAEYFNQSAYQFDVRNHISSTDIIEMISKMNDNYKQESETIRKGLEVIQDINPYDYITLKETGK